MSAPPGPADRPLPLPDADTAAFWDGCARGVLLLQRCAACAAPRHPPRPMCPRCRSLDSVWSPATGRGAVYSFVICHPPVLPAFAAAAPYAVVLVELEDGAGLRLVGGLAGCAPDELRIGLTVEVWFEAAGEGVWLPQWRPRNGPAMAAKP